MIEKTLHGVNVGACCLQIVTGAVDIASTGGAATLAGAGLSLVGLRGKTKEQADVATQMVQALESYLNTTHLTGDQQKHLVQMLDGHSPSLTDIAQGNRTPKTIAQNLRKHIETTTSVPEYKDTTTLNAFQAMVEALLTPLLVPQTQEQADTAVLLERTKGSQAYIRMLEAGITEGAVIKLAQRIAADTHDVAQAWIQLESAMDLAVQVQQEGATPSNHGDFVDEVLARVAEMTATGDYEAAGAELDAAMEAADAQLSRLIGRNIKVALLAGDTGKAAGLIVRQADMDAGGVAGFGDLRALFIHHYEIGHDKGDNLQSALAIDLAQRVLDRASTADERGVALNDLGAALASLGERDSDTARLEHAVTAYTEALKERTRDRVPMDWAMTQMNLGNALLSLGERDSDSARLEHAVTAYTEALKECTRDRAPMDWAMTQMNLGNALQRLGARDIDSARLEQAVTAYTEALKECTRDRVPMDWAMTQMNLGNALATLGERNSDSARLEQAVTAYTEALKENTRDRVPMQWAITQMNLGTALARFGERDSDSARLEQAVTAYTEALKENTRDRVPMDWAMTQMNLGTALRTLGERDSDTARLEHAVSAYTEALKECTRDRVPMDWAMTQGNLAVLEVAFFDLTGEAAHLDRALGHAQAAREVFARAQARQYLEMIDRNMAKIEARRG